MSPRRADPWSTDEPADHRRRAARPAIEARTYATSLKSHGKPAGIIACVMARRANKIAFAMVRDQIPYDPSRWKDRPAFTTRART